MKKTICILLILILGIFLFACGNSADDTLESVSGSEETNGSNHEHSYGAAVADPDGIYETKTCTLCGEEVTSLIYKTILKYDFETDMELADYMSAAEDFTITRNADYAEKIETEADGNRYAHLIGGVYLNDEKLALIKTENYVVEYDIMYTEFPSKPERAAVALLPYWRHEDQSRVKWLSVARINSKTMDGAIDIAGEMVILGTNGNTSTGIILEPNKWYHITIVLDTVKGTSEFYIGERGSDLYLPFAIGSIPLSWGEGDSTTYFENAPYNAFRLADDGDVVNFDNVHIYAAKMPLWDAE